MKVSMNQSSLSVGLLAIVAISWMGGCGSPRDPNRPQTFTTSGRLTLEGKVVEGATVSFSPSSGPSAVGITDPQGQFELTTFSKGDGAVAGEHVVTVTRFEVPKPAGSTEGEYVPPSAPLPTPKNSFPKKYGSPETSGLKVTVEPKPANVIPLDLAG